MNAQKQFKLYAANEKTGQEVTVRVTANDERDAERRARAAGLLVAKVEQIRSDTPSRPPPLPLHLPPDVTGAGLTPGVPPVRNHDYRCGACSTVLPSNVAA